MKTWRNYEKYLLTGEWHVHTNFTDGKNTIDEICEKALERGIPLVAFTEHVRRELKYSFENFLTEIERARKKYKDLIILSGVEAKVLPDGSLDVEPEILDIVDYPIFAFHSFQKDRELYIKCLRKAIENPYVNGWAHPGLFLVKTGFNLTNEELKEIFKLMSANDVLLEINSRYRLPRNEWIKVAQSEGVRIVRGTDLHDIVEMQGNL